MFRKSIIKKYIDLEGDGIEIIINHHFSVYFLLFLKTIAFLGILTAAFWLVDKYIIWEYTSISFAIVGIILFVKFCLDFLNLYLDSLILTNTWITLFLWEWILENSVEVFYRDKIETISYRQRWFWNRILFSWDIDISLDDGINLEFEDVHRPKKQIDKILRIKEKYLLQNMIGKDEKKFHNDLDDDKFNILVDALSDVVKDYVEKKDEDKEDWYY